MVIRPVSSVGEGGELDESILHLISKVSPFDSESENLESVYGSKTSIDSLSNC